MATLKACVRRPRKDGFYQVYIRVTHHRSAMFIKTDKMLTGKQLTKSKEIKDPLVLQYCSTKILEFNDKLNSQDTENWTVKEVVDFLVSGSCDICFSDYARVYHDRMVNRGQERNARNYELAYQHLERFAGTNQLMFSQLTSTFVTRWIESLAQTRRAKEMYPTCVRQVFRSAQAEYNDYDTGNIRIKTNPWIKVRIPKSDTTAKLAITPEACRAFFSAPIPESNYKYPLPELGRDVAMMILCLGGINTVDLYRLKKGNLKDGIICYKRAKTCKSRADEAYMEMRVPMVLGPLVEKYKAGDNDDYLFNFHSRHTSSDSFCANVNRGIHDLCASMGMAKDECYKAYTFRHTWATIAQNDCGATIDEVAFGMNHSRGRNVTRGYIRIDFSPAWELNEKVVELVFFTEKVSHRETEKRETNSFGRFSPKYLMRGACWFRGRKLCEVEDIGFHNVDEIISRLAISVPADVPERAMVQFKIENVDKGQSVIYERMKGKGF